MDQQPRFHTIIRTKAKGHSIKRVAFLVEIRTHFFPAFAALIFAHLAFCAALIRAIPSGPIIFFAGVETGSLFRVQSLS
jgi:hypothetical protein